MSELEREIAWKKAARGRGLRWQLLRDLIGSCHVVGMTTEQIQDVMTVLRGLSRRKTNEFIQEMEDAGFLQSQEVKEGRLRSYYWGPTTKGVSLWLGSRRAIPVRIAEVVFTITSALPSEVHEDDETENRSIML